MGHREGNGLKTTLLLEGKLLAEVLISLGSPARRRSSARQVFLSIALDGRPHLYRRPARTPSAVLRSSFSSCGCKVKVAHYVITNQRGTFKFSVATAVVREGCSHFSWRYLSRSPYRHFIPSCGNRASGRKAVNRLLNSVLNGQIFIKFYRRTITNFLQNFVGADCLQKFSCCDNGMYSKKITFIFRY